MSITVFNELPTDYNLEVLQGNIPGHSMVAIIGFNDDAINTRVTISPEITLTDIDQSGLHATPTTVQVASTSSDDASGGDGLKAVGLLGLDSNGDVQSELIVLDGTTPVTSAGTYSAINGLRGLSLPGLEVGVLNENQGHLYVGNGSFTGGTPDDTIYFSGEIGHNRGTTAYYTVPAGHTFIPRQSITNSDANKEIDIQTETSADGVFWVKELSFVFETGGGFVVPSIAFPGFGGGNHFRLTSLADGAQGTKARGVFVGELVEL